MDACEIKGTSVMIWALRVIVWHAGDDLFTELDSDDRAQSRAFSSWSP